MALTLYATEIGRPLHERLGFRTVARAVTHAGEFRPAPDDVGPAFETSIMVYGEDLPGDRRRLFLPLMQALG